MQEMDRNGGGGGVMMYVRWREGYEEVNTSI